MFQCRSGESKRGQVLSYLLQVEEWHERGKWGERDGDGSSQ